MLIDCTLRVVVEVVFMPGSEGIEVGPDDRFNSLQLVASDHVKAAVLRSPHLNQRTRLLGQWHIFIGLLDLLVYKVRAA